jgi:O-acetyl-ADP-ribose deacetylase (regulator of RNase III)
MIIRLHGDLLTSQAAVLVNPVNCVGVMGKGLARAFAGRFPSLVAPYRAACRHGLLRPGGVQFVPLPQAGRCVANLATKDHWRDPSRYAWIQAGLEALIAGLRSRGAPSVALPPLGCGLGGLDWARVRPLIVRTFSLRAPGITVFLYEPGPGSSRGPGPAISVSVDEDSPHELPHPH